MRLMCRSGSVLLLLFASNCRASLVLEDFESGSDGWTANPLTTWEVGGNTTVFPQIGPMQGSFFARSGEPNSASESDTGTFTSPMYFVTYSTLQWLSGGFSGGSNTAPADGISYFEILDVNGVQKVKVDAPQSNGPPYDPAWGTPSVNLLDYFQPGDAFFFRAVDGHNEAGFSWLAFDNLQLTGTPVAAVPEAASFFIWGLLGLSCCVYRRSREANC
jgi:hypothetical protein